MSNIRPTCQTRSLKRGAGSLLIHPLSRTGSGLLPVQRRQRPSSSVGLVTFCARHLFFTLLSFPLSLYPSPLTPLFSLSIHVAAAEATNSTNIEALSDATSEEDAVISQAASQPGSQAARQPGSQAARQPGSQAARQCGSSLAASQAAGQAARRLSCPSRRLADHAAWQPGSQAARQPGSRWVARWPGSQSDRFPLNTGTLRDPGRSS